MDWALPSNLKLHFTKTGRQRRKTVLVSIFESQLHRRKELDSTFFDVVCETLACMTRNGDTGTQEHDQSQGQQEQDLA
jgi:hypothetical protein